MTLASRASRPPRGALWSLVAAVAPTIALAPSTRAWAIEAPHAVGDVSSPPEILDRKDPAYPEARLIGDHGPDERLPELDVEIEVRLDEKGAVLSAVVLVSGGADFDEAALAATRSWTYKPAIRGGVAVPSTFHIPIHFEPPPHEEPTQVSIVGPKASAPRGASDFRVNLGELAIVPRKGAGDLLKLTPSVFLLRDGGGEGHADRVYLRGFDAREGQDIEFSVDGVPLNESANYHGAGYADLNAILPEVVSSLRVLQGPFDPHQGNFAVAGSADYQLGLARRGLTAGVTYGSWNTFRFLGTWGPVEESDRTFAAADVFRTDGYGQNRGAWRARAVGQYEGRLGDAASFRLQALAHATEYQSAGVLRESDVESGEREFYDASDRDLGGSAMRGQMAFDLSAKSGDTTFDLKTFGIYRSLGLRENYTGFLLDEQLARQDLHSQRGDRIDLGLTSGTFGLRSSGRYRFDWLGASQEAEVGVFARMDLANNLQQRITAAGGNPYRTDANFDSKLGNVGLYADVALRLQSWLALRGGLRTDLFFYDVSDLCAVKDVSRPDESSEASCLAEQRFGDHREPNQRSSTAAAIPMPRVTLSVGPFEGFSFSLAYGQGARAIDASYITQDVATPFATIDAGDLGIGYARSFEDFSLTSVVSFFVTHVDRDQIFSVQEGRATLAEGTTRTGASWSGRAVFDFLDVSMSASLTRARFDDTGLLVPYVPDVVVRHDGALFHDLFSLDDSPVVGRLGVGLSVIGPRALPYGERSDALVTVDAAASVRFRFLEFELAGTNLADLQAKAAEFNYVSDFEPSDGRTTLVPSRHFAAAAPLGVFGTLKATLGGNER